MSRAALEKLEELIRKTQDRSALSNDRVVQEGVYTYITKEILPSFKANEKLCPPLAVLTYATREIISPTFATSFIGELLSLLVQVERVRQLIVENVKLALEEQEALQKEKAPRTATRLLDERNVKKLKLHVKKSKARREHYATLTYELRLLHIYTLWSSSESYTLPRRIREYFPAVTLPESEVVSNDELWQGSILMRDTAPEERKDIYELGRQVKKFMMNANEWEERRKRRWEEEGLPMDDFYKSDDSHSYISEFEEQFPKPVAVDDMLTGLGSYIAKVEDMATYVTSLFPTR